MAEFAFSLPIPSHFERDGQKIPCPPSFFVLDGGIAVEITYTLRFDATFQGSKKKHKTECRTIGIYYLPKNAPAVAPLTVLPAASRHCENPPLFLEGTHRMSCEPIVPSFPTQSSSKRKQSAYQISKCLQMASSVYVSYPKFHSKTPIKVLTVNPTTIVLDTFASNVYSRPNHPFHALPLLP